MTGGNIPPTSVYGTVPLSISNFQRSSTSLQQEMMPSFTETSLSNIPRNRRNRLVNLTFIDWDDTLFPTSFFARYQLLHHEPRSISPPFSTEIRRLDLIARNLIQTSLKFGIVVVVTNGLMQWVEDSGSAYLPRLYHCMRRNRVEVISARDLYEQSLQNQVTAWKVLAFQSIVASAGLENESFSLVSIGDQPAEHIAARNIAVLYPNCRVKIVMFKNDPGIKFLCRELFWVTEHFSEIARTYLNCEVRYDDQPGLVMNNPEQNCRRLTLINVLGRIFGSVKSATLALFHNFSASLFSDSSRRKKTR